MSTLIDRLMLPVRPRPVRDFAPAPRAIVPGLWRIDRKLRMPAGPRLPASATVLRLPDGGRLTLLRDANGARPYLRKMLEKGFERIVVAHGEPVEADARKEFRRAFRAYLDAA